MLFNSYIFIFAFLPICLAGFYLLRSRSLVGTKMWLVICSLVFYGYFNPIYLVIIIGSVIANYGLQLLFKHERYNKLVLAAGVAANLAVLFYFKYFDFFIENINAVFKTGYALKYIMLPLGISFFTFQQISFLHDSYKGEMRNISLVDYALFVTFFPQLIAGPIVTGEEMLPQFNSIGERKFDSENFSRGLMVFVGGLAKKVIIADTFAGAVDYGYTNLASISSTEALLVMLFYTLQLYFDFSGYCDMAIGIGRMFGINIALNFNSPYKASNIIEFWKRWHITLSRFFTKNVYIPLGGNRCGNLRMYTNLFIVFFLSGLWHGAGWNYIIWGCMHGTLYVTTRAWQNIRKSRKVNGEVNTSNLNRILKILGVLATFIFVNIAWVFFRADSVNTAMTLLGRIAEGEWRIPAESFAAYFNLGEFWYVLKVLHISQLPYSKYYLMILFSAIILCVTFFAPNIHEVERKMKFGSISAIIVGVLLVWCIVSLSGVSTFLYFNF